MKTNYKKQADKRVNEIDLFIKKQKENDEYLFAALILKRLLNFCDESDIDLITFEMECKFGLKYIKCDSLAEEMKIEQFISELTANPYQLQLIA